jgi:LuxR family maltose regulon positive regulatory protein
MPHRVPGQGPPATRPPEGSLRQRPSDSVSAGRLLRQRLLTALSRAVDRAPVTLLSGPAGSGKTVLAATWGRQVAAFTAVAWVSLVGDDVDVGEF